MGRARHLAKAKGKALLDHLLFQRETIGQGLGLIRRPSSDLAGPRTGGEIGIGLSIRHRRHRSAHTHLTAQRFPVEQQGRLRVRCQFAALGTGQVGVKNKAARIDVL